MSAHVLTDVPRTPTTATAEPAASKGRTGAAAKGRSRSSGWGPAPPAAVHQVA